MTVFPGLNQLLTKIGYETPGFGKERKKCHHLTRSPHCWRPDGDTTPCGGAA